VRIGPALAAAAFALAAYDTGVTVAIAARNALKMLVAAHDVSRPRAPHRHLEREHARLVAVTAR
jgi:hypothetical protein